MTKRSRAGAGALAAIGLSLGCGAWAYAQTPSSVPHPIQKGAGMAAHATGSFDVKLAPQAPVEHVGDLTIGRMAIDKRFHGDLEGTSKGEMLATTTEVQGSAGYVALERVTGMLHGRRGTFALQHSGTMTRGTPQLTITVVPDSGTGQLVGLAGTMTIIIVDGKHSYELEYTIPEAPR